MPVLGFNLTKVEMKKVAKGIPKGSINVRLTPQITDVRLGEIRTPTGKMNGVEILFKYTIVYEPEIAEGALEGAILYLPRQKELMDEILDLWENEKKVKSEMFAEIVNFITKEVTPMIMLLAKEMNLPSPVPLPRVEVKK